MAAPKLDAVTAAAVDLARAAAQDAAGDFGVGEYLGAQVEDERVVSHTFACEHPGYVGWVWTVTLARALRAKAPTVDEVVLLPGPQALTAPGWVPWVERIESGDLLPGMLMPTAPGDPRLDPGYVWSPQDEDVDGPAVRAVVTELGLGRERLLSPYGRDLATERWLDGEGGPDTAMAHQAPAPCCTCGFFVRLRGTLGATFGACANALSPSDAQVVSIDHGCGAHSDVVPETDQPDTEPYWDTVETVASLFD